MRLVEQGKVDLRAPVRIYIPNFRVRDSTVSRDVTVWHLLTHLGGWEGQVSGPDRGSATLENFVASPTLTDLMQVAPPGKAWSYNNAGFSIAGRVIETATGTSINRALRDLVFQPLGLEHAGTTAGDFIVNRFAAGHTVRNGSPALNRPFSPSTSVTAGGVGICMTDLLAYARFHMGDGLSASGERVLKRESLELLRTPQLRKQANDDDMGIGWHLRAVGGVRTASHGGTLGGHILLLEIAPERDFAIAVLTNANTGWRVIQDVEREARAVLDVEAVVAVELGDHVGDVDHEARDRDPDAVERGRANADLATVAAGRERERIALAVEQGRPRVGVRVGMGSLPHEHSDDQDEGSTHAAHYDATRGPDRRADVSSRIRGLEAAVARGREPLLVAIGVERGPGRDQTRPGEGGREHR